MNYLNTECKDAMNLTDFINSFEFSLKDLEMLNNKGYQEAMEHTFVKQLVVWRKQSVQYIAVIRNANLFILKITMYGKKIRIMRN